MFELTTLVVIGMLLMLIQLMLNDISSVKTQECWILYLVSRASIGFKPKVEVEYTFTRFTCSINKDLIIYQFWILIYTLYLSC